MSKEKQPKHGGRRKGAGRKPSDPSGRKRPVTVWLSPAEVAHCQRLGGSAVRLRQLLAADMQAG